MNAKDVKAGMRVTYSGFPGTIRDVCEWSRNTVDGVEGVLVNVRVPGGVTCVCASELIEVKGEAGSDEQSRTGESRATSVSGGSPREASRSEDEGESQSRSKSDKPDYTKWYSDWMKQLARHYTRQEIESRLGNAIGRSPKAAESHLRAIRATGSMHSQSQRRAQTRNVVAALGEEKIALRGALEIHALFPQHAKSM